MLFKFTHLFTWLAFRAIQKTIKFTYTTVASITVGRNRAVRVGSQALTFIFFFVFMLMMDVMILMQEYSFTLLLFFLLLFYNSIPLKYTTVLGPNT